MCLRGVVIAFKFGRAIDSKWTAPDISTTLDATRDNLRKAVQLMLAANRALAEDSIADQLNFEREPFELTSASG